MREMRTKTLQFLAPFLLTPTIAGCILAILAPLGTDTLTILGRFSFWIGLSVAGGVGASGAQYLASRFIEPRRAGPLTRWPRAFVHSIGATAIVSLFLFQLQAPPDKTAIALTLFYVWVIAITISSIGALRTAPVQTIEPPTTPAPPALIKRLKPALRDKTIYALEAQDHYVRVITSGGEDLILMRLSDAIAEIRPLAGLSPHRSWWVAEKGAKSVIRQAGKAIITLHTGENTPVSRNCLKTLRAAGWL